MIYVVQGSWDGNKWWTNNLSRSGDPKFETQKVEIAVEFAKNYVKYRPFKYRQVVDEKNNVVWSYNP